ncbi:MAG: ABC transporter permease [Micromonosporaceae bacterium]
MTMTMTTIDSGNGRLRRFGLLRHSLVLAWRSLAKASRNPGAVVNSVVTPALFLVLFLYLFGGSVAGSTRDYIQYLFPGILVMGAGLAGMLSTGVGITIDMKKGVFDRFRSLPIGRTAPLLGSLLADVVRYAAAVTILFGIGYLLGFRVQTGLPSALAAATLAITFGFCLSWSTVLLAALAKDESVVLAFSFIAFLPLQLGTSLAAPTDTLPGWLRAWANVNPVTQVMDASRTLLIGTPTGNSLVFSLAWSAALLVIFCPLAVLAYRRRQ